MYEWEKEVNFVGYMILRWNLKCQALSLGLKVFICNQEIGTPLCYMAGALEFQICCFCLKDHWFNSTRLHIVIDVLQS